jgi:hypothetical protein
MQDNVGAARRIGDGGAIADPDLQYFSTHGSAPGRARPHQARHRPASIAERFGGRAAEATGGAEHEDPTRHAISFERAQTLRKAYVGGVSACMNLIEALMASRPARC